MFAPGRFTSSIVSLSSFSQVNSELDYALTESSNMTSDSPTTAQDVFESYVGGTSVQCRIQWLGGSSKFLVPCNPESKGNSDLIVVEVRNGLRPRGSEWTLTWRRGTSDCTIRPNHNTKLYFNGRNLTSIPAYIKISQVEPPFDAARNNTWGDVKGHWTCVMIAPGGDRVSVPFDIDRTPVNLLPGIFNNTKNNMWRIQVLKEGMLPEMSFDKTSEGALNAPSVKSIATSVAIPRAQLAIVPPVAPPAPLPSSMPSSSDVVRPIPPTPPVNAPPLTSVPLLPLPQNNPPLLRKMRCLLLTGRNKKKRYLNADSRGLFGKRVKVCPHPTEWIVVPAGKHYTIQSTNDSRYLTINPRVGLSKSPMKWIISDFYPPGASKPANSPDMSTLYPAFNNRLVFRMDKRGKLIVTKAPASRLKDKYRWRFMWVKGRTAPLNPSQPAERQVGQPRQSQVESNTNPRNTDRSNQGSYCRISCQLNGETMYLAPVWRSDTIDTTTGLSLVSQNAPRWILTSNSDGYMIHPNPDADGNACNAASWVLDKVLPVPAQASYMRPLDVLEAFICEIRQISVSRPALTGICVPGRKFQDPNICGTVLLNYGSSGSFWRIEVQEEVELLVSQHQGSESLQYINSDDDDDSGDDDSDSSSEEDRRSAVRAAAPIASASSAVASSPILNTSSDPGSHAMPHRVLDWVHTYATPSLNTPAKRYRDEGSVVVVAPGSTHHSRSTISVSSVASRESEYQGLSRLASTLRIEDQNFKGPKTCRIQHVLTGEYLVSRPHGVELAERTHGDVWIMRAWGPGFTFNFVPRGLDLSLRYLAPSNNNDVTSLCSSTYPAAWHMVQKQEQNSTTMDAEEVEWICKLCWPFSENRILVDKTKVWVGPGQSGSLSALDEYWRIQFLLAA